MAGVRRAAEGGGSPQSTAGARGWAGAADTTERGRARGRGGARSLPGSANGSSGAGEGGWRHLELRRSLPVVEVQQLVEQVLRANEEHRPQRLHASRRTPRRDQAQRRGCMAGRVDGKLAQRQEVRDGAEELNQLLLRESNLGD
eukprot:6983072-Prymnesium_polylepis.1